MVLHTDATLLRLFGAVLGLLTLASGIGALLNHHVQDPALRATVQNVNARIRAWWIMAIVFIASLSTGRVGSIVLFGVLSFLALREFVTLAPTAPADHRALVWCFFVATPLQYALVWEGRYELFTILVPVYLAIFV